jgi:hypothetical protein
MTDPVMKPFEIFVGKYYAFGQRSRLQALILRQFEGQLYAINMVCVNEGYGYLPPCLFHSICLVLSFPILSSRFLWQSMHWKLSFVFLIESQSPS